MNIYLQQIQEIALPNKYTKWYIQIVTNIHQRTKITSYFEKHHITPRSIAPEYIHCKENIICATAKEHFILHILLTKMFNNNFQYKMLLAFNWMSNQKKVNSKLYTKLRIKAAKAISEANKGHVSYNKGTKHSDETKAKMSASHKGRICRPHTPETKAKISEKAKNRIVSEETKIKLRRAAKLKSPESEETKLKKSQSLKGRTKTKEHIENIRLSRIRNGNLGIKNYLAISPTGESYVIKRSEWKEFSKLHKLTEYLIRTNLEKGKISSSGVHRYNGWEFKILK